MQVLKRLILFISLGLCITCSPKIDQKKFEAVHRAAKSIEASTTVGVNYQKLQQQLQDLATETLLAKDKVKSEGEKELLGNYSEVLGMYKDSAILWQHKIKDGDNYLYLTGQDGTITVDSEVKAITEKYNLAMAPNDARVMLADEGIQRIWASAGQRLEKMSASFQGTK